MQALSERLSELLAGEEFAKFDAFSFAGLKTVRPAPADLIGTAVEKVSRRGKYLVITTTAGPKLLIHLSQAGRLDVESPAKATKPRGSVVRISFASGNAILLREYGTERKAGWWILDARDDGPLTTLGPEADSAEFAAALRASEDGRHLHTALRDQHFVAGLGRGHTDDVLHKARLSPFTSIRALSSDEREQLLDAIRTTLSDALSVQRQRQGGLSDASLGDDFLIHNHAGQACPRCGDRLERVSYDSYEIVYCPTCQTKGKLLADRRLSRLLR
jgi:formamidopyrimidine-DNA glycosylase